MTDSIDNLAATEVLVINKPVLAVFDFDGTLTFSDSFVPFLKYAFGTKVFSRKLIGLLLPSLAHLSGRISRDQLKEKLVAHFLTGVPEAWFNEKAQAFCDERWAKLLRPAGIQGVAAEVAAGHEVTLCSASPELLLRPFAAKLNVKLIATQLEVINGQLTGKIAGVNCRCASKVQRLQQVYGDLETYHLRAWGDTAGDEQLLAAAHDPHWRYFHKNSKA